MNVTPYIFFQGNCAEALDFYKKAVDARVEATMTYGGSPACAQMPKEMHDKIMHSSFKIGDSIVMAADSPPEQWSGKPAGYALTIGVKSAGEAERIFGGLAEGGSIVMALGETFFAERFGMLTDRFGISWMVIFEKAH